MIDTPTEFTARRDTDQEFTAFMHTAYSSLLRTAYLLTADRGLAEDLVQTVLTALYLRWDRLRGVRDRGALMSYARTALARQATSWWRRRRGRERTVDVVPEPSVGPVSTDPFTITDHRRQLLTHLAQLPARQRAAVVLRYFDDLTETETAAALGCSVGTAKSHTHRGIVRLRQLMAVDDALEGILR